MVTEVRRGLGLVGVLARPRGEEEGWWPWGREWSWATAWERGAREGGGLMTILEVSGVLCPRVRVEPADLWESWDLWELSEGEGLGKNL